VLSKQVWICAGQHHAKVLRKCQTNISCVSHTNIYGQHAVIINKTITEMEHGKRLNNIIISSVRSVLMQGYTCI